MFDRRSAILTFVPRFSVLGAVNIQGDMANRIKIELKKTLWS